MKRNDPNIQNIFFPAPLPECPTPYEQYYKEMRDLKITMIKVFGFVAWAAVLPFLIEAYFK